MSDVNQDQSVQQSISVSGAIYNTMDDADALYFAKVNKQINKAKVYLLHSTYNIVEAEQSIEDGILESVV